MGITCVFIGVWRVQEVCRNRHLVGRAGRTKYVVAGVAGTWDVAVSSGLSMITAMSTPSWREGRLMGLT